ncbi:uncharacterized protein LOC133737183 [Rosa rugosa]|uniref:uncharacterized protein LOC133737183 n=1 Tax=Rosa rugosa TaxID=74645 RepID=UPI002B40D554|nr:uncharacterized protein LOC133737183 [Rosa rugosa]
MKASLPDAERKRLEQMVAQQKLDDVPEDVREAIRQMDAAENAQINKEQEEKQLPPEVVDWEESKVYNFMDQDTKRRVQKYWQNAPSGVYFWDGRQYGAQVSRQDLKDMIMDEPIASNCIECYGILLTDQLLEKESQDLDVPTFMNPLCWNSAENLTVYYVHLYLCEPLFQNLARSNYIFFPISHESGFHHTLLIFDKELNEWYHCDSKRPKKPSTGKSFQNVQKMVDMVELWMTAVKQQADDMLEQGCRMKFDEKNSSEEELKMIEVPLTETERESIKWIKDNYKQKMAVTELKDNPQQGKDSLDCGLFVMYTMEIISKKGKVPKKLAKDDILNFRAHVVKSFAEKNKNNLTEGTLELLQKTPFATLIDAFHGGSIKEKDAKKSDDLITLLLQAYNSDTDLFVFGNRKFRMSTSDISMILGVPGSGLSVPKTKEGAYRSEFVTIYFDKKQRINKAAAEEALKKALAEAPETGDEKTKRDRNVAVLVLLNLFIKLLFPNSGGTISWDYIRVCEEVESLGKYSWAKEVGDFLKKSIKRKAKESQNMAGCVILVMVTGQVTGQVTVNVTVKFMSLTMSLFMYLHMSLVIIGFATRRE